MPGKKFLNPYLKVGICAVGLVLMGYFLIQQIQSGDEYDRLFFVRALVFAGFLFLLIRGVIEIFSRSKNAGEDAG